MSLTPPQWGSAPTRTSNVNIVRHVKDTVEIQKIQGKDITWPLVRADWYHTRRRGDKFVRCCRGGSGTSFGLYVFYVRSLYIANKLRHRHSKMLQPHPYQYSIRSSFTFADCNEPTAVHSYS